MNHRNWMPPLIDVLASTSLLDALAPKRRHSIQIGPGKRTLHSIHNRANDPRRQRDRIWREQERRRRG